MKIPSSTKITRKISTPSALAIALAISLSSPSLVSADASNKKNIAPLKPDVPYLFVVHNGRSIKIERDVYDSFSARIGLRGSLIQMADSCPPFCLLPQNLDVPVQTVGEAEIIDFMLTKLRDSSGTLVDVRGEKSHAYATIPGSLNYFIQIFLKGPGDNKFDAMLETFGAKRRGEISAVTKLLETIGINDSSMLTDNWDFTEAKELIIWTTSSIDDSAGSAIKALLDAGYPASKLKWYRGGLASWQYWGFNTYRTVSR